VTPGLWGTFQRTSLGPRTLTAVLGGPLLLGAMWLGGLWWAAVLAVILLLAEEEFSRLHPDVPPPGRALTLVGAVVVAVIAVQATGRPAVLFFAGGLLVLSLALSSGLTAPIAPEARWRGWKAVIVGAVYLGLPAGLLLRWRLEAPFAALGWLFAIIWANDIAAYFVGLAAGRHKIAPQISPGKSWEGATAGLVAGAVVGLLGAPVWGLYAGGGAILGAMASVVSQSGDFLESAMKRRAGVKDSGSILPGHGGVLDRFDGMLVAVPYVYLSLAAVAMLRGALR
jgi:phosphatidate cytidylyltransferase